MSTCKAALRVVLQHPVYVVIYLVFLSFMGVFVVQSMIGDESESSEFVGFEATVAVVDRDGSIISRALSDHLAETCEMVLVADDGFAMQDAVATGYVDCLLVVPEGFGESYLSAARGGVAAQVDALSQIEATFSYASAAGTLAREEAGSYLRLLAEAAALDPGASAQECADRADAASAEEASIDEVPPTSAAPFDASWFAQYLVWGSYTLTASISVCVGLLMRAFSRTDTRRRIVASPLSSSAFGMQLAASSLGVACAAWAVSLGIGVAFFGWALAGVPAHGIVLAIVASAVFALVPASLGFFVGQLGADEAVFNAVGNIVGMLMSFLGGAWISLDLLAPEVQAASLFAPSRWYAAALYGALGLTDSSSEAMLPVAACIGVVALFAAALFVLALAVGRARRRSADAGGNAAAAVVS